MYLDKDAILNSLTKEDIKKIVVSLGSLEPKVDGNGDMMFQTICHNPPDPSNSYKLYYYHEPNGEYKGRLFHCYSGCNDSFGIVELVIRANRVQGHTITWYKALKYIGQMSGKLKILDPNEITVSTKIIDDFEWINRLKALKKKKKTVPQLHEINENILEIFTYLPHEDWLNDNISREAMSRFEIGYWGEHDAITIPHRDMNGRLIGLRLRNLDPYEIEQKRKYVPACIEGKVLRHQLGNNLYGLYVTKERIQQIKKIMIVEAEKSCLQAYSYFGDNSFVVATCGSAITLTQIKIILELGVEEVIYAPDRDYHAADSYEAQLWWNKQIKKVAPFIPYCRVYLCADSKDRLEYKDSPTDRGKDILLKLLEEKILITMKDIEEMKSEAKN